MKAAIKAGTAMSILCLIAWMMLSQQPNSNPAKQQSAEATNTQQNTAVAGKNQPDTGSDHAPKSNNSSPRWYASPEWAGVIVAAIGIGVIGWQSWETRRAAQASTQNIELYINKERARVRVELKPLILPAKVTAESPYTAVDFRVSIYGPTDAFITDSSCAAYVFPEEIIEQPNILDRVMFPVHNLTPVIPANSEPLNCFAFLGFENDTDNLLLAEVKAGRMFVGIRGFIKYRDVFDRERETFFRYVWRSPHKIPGLDDFDHADWVKSGRPEENRKT